MVVGIVGTMLLLIVALQFTSVQRFIAKKVISSISEKTGTHIGIGSVEIAFTHSVVLRDIFVESQQRDTLLSIHSLALDVNLFGLLSNTIRLSNVRIDSMTAHITRSLPDSAFNFDFILDSLTADSLPSTALPETSSAGQWNITVGGVDLQHINVSYDDDVSGLNALLNIGRLKLSIDTFDLANNRFHIDDASIEHTRVSLQQTKKTSIEESTSSNLDIGVGTVSLEHVQVTYENRISGDQYTANVGSSEIVAEKISLPKHILAVKSVRLDRSTFSAVMKRVPEDTSKQRPDSSGMDWVIGVQNLQINNNSIQYEISNDTVINGFDPNHLFIKDLAVDAENIYFSEKRMGAGISHISFVEKSGFTLLELSGKVTFDSLHAALGQLLVQTPTSRIHQNVVLSYPSLAVLYNDIGNATLNATLNESTISVTDLLLFQPLLPLRNDSAGAIRTSLEISGLVNDLHIKKFTLTTGDSTFVELSGAIRGLPEIKTTNFEIDLHRFSSGREDILSFVSDSLIPKEIVIPSLMNASGKFNGTIDNFSASTDIQTTIGNIFAKATLSSSDKENATSAQWTADVNIKEFDLGALLNDTATFGAVSLKASLTGTGLTKEDILAEINVSADKIELNGYSYRRLSIEGTASAAMFKGKAEIQDSNIAFVFNGFINTGKKDPAYKFIFDLKGADLQRLHLMDDDIRVAGVIKSDLIGEGINDINGIVDIRNVVITKNGKRYLIDSLMYASVNNANETHISFASTI
ncbi:MAG: AsmA family protein, partial [Bacteroidota bacterium]